MFFICSFFKSFFFSFFLYFFQYFLLLALVSEFNCFLRSRCSMEMWCPDDKGRDSWDWVGPPACGGACFNSPEWRGGSSPVKTKPPQIVLLLLLFGTRLDVCVWSLHTGQCRTQSLRLIGGRSPGSQTPGDPATRALDDEELFIVEGSKNSTRANFGQLGKSADTRGFAGKTVRISM